MADTVTTNTGNAIRLTTYMGGPDNASPGDPTGGNRTKTGVDLNENYATFAIPGKWHDHPGNEDRTNLKLGDIVLFTNVYTEKNKDGTPKLGEDGKPITHTYKALGWATDLGGMPHGDIDVAKGALEKGLGIKCVTNKKDIYDPYSKQTIPAGQYALDTTGQGDVSAERVAHISAKGFANPNVVNEAIKAVNKDLAEGKITPDQLQAKLAELIKDPKTLELADAESKKVRVSGRQGGYESYAEARKNGHLYRSDSEDEMAQIEQYMQSDPAMGFLLLIVAFLDGSLTKSQAEAPAAPEHVRAASEKVPQEKIDAGKKDIKDTGATPATEAGKIIDSLQGAIKSSQIKVEKGVDVSSLSPKSQEALAELAKNFKEQTGHTLNVLYTPSSEKVNLQVAESDNEKFKEIAKKMNLDTLGGLGNFYIDAKDYQSKDPTQLSAATKTNGKDTQPAVRNFT